MKHTSSGSFDSNPNSSSAVTDRHIFEEMMLIMITSVYYILLCACYACIISIRIETIERGSQTFISLFK